MFDIQREELNWCGRDLVLETGRIVVQGDCASLMESDDIKEFYIGDFSRKIRFDDR